jgi:aminoglycoside phosphotransferase (APT) family kinase protein
MAADADANDAEALAAGLARLAPMLVAGGASVGDLAPLSGGASQELWSFEIRGPAETRRFVLRRTPLGSDAPTHKAGLETEARLIECARAHGIPSPAVRHILRPADDIGCGFIMDHVAGETIARRILRDAPYDAIRPQLAGICGEILARIHALPLADLPMLRRTDAATRIAEIAARYARTGTRRPVFDLAIRWLRDHLPPAPRIAAVHGDFRLGNLIVDPAGIRAVLDWESTHLGDPMEDLGWICMIPWRFGCIDRPVGGFGSREALFAAYERTSGVAVDRAAVHFWELLGSLYWGVSCATSAVSDLGLDQRPIERAMIGRRASESELDILRLLDGDA